MNIFFAIIFVLFGFFIFRSNLITRNSENLKISPFLPFILAFSAFMQMLDGTVLNTALPTIAVELNESPLRMQSVVISYALIMALVMPLSAFFCDKFGTRRVFIVSVYLFTLGSFLCALSQSLSFLIFSRIVQGAGGAMLLPVQRLILMRSYDKSELLRKMDLVLIPALIGPVLGPPLGGYLVEYASWQWIFLINLPIGLLVIVCAMFILPNFQSDKESAVFKNFDKFGMFMFCLSALLLTLAAEIAVRPQYFLYAIVLAVIGGIFFISYWIHAYFYPHAVFPLRLFLIRTFRIGVIGNLATRLGISAMPFLLPLMLQIAFNYPPSTAGLLMVAQAVGSMFAKFMMIRILYIFGYRNILLWNTKIIAFIIFLFGFLNGGINLGLMIILLFLLGFFNSVQFSAMNTLTLSRLREDVAASGNTLIVVNQQLAMTFGIAIAAILLNWLRDFSALSDSITKPFSYCFYFFSVVSFLSSFIFMKLHRKDGSVLLK